MDCFRVTLLDGNSPKRNRVHGSTLLKTAAPFQFSQQFWDTPTETLRRWCRVVLAKTYIRGRQKWGPGDLLMPTWPWQPPMFEIMPWRSEQKSWNHWDSTIFVDLPSTLAGAAWRWHRRDITHTKKVDAPIKCEAWLILPSKHIQRRQWYHVFQMSFGVLVGPRNGHFPVPTGAQKYMCILQ